MTADPAWIIPVRKETVNNVSSIVLKVDLFHTEEGEHLVRQVVEDNEDDEDDLSGRYELLALTNKYLNIIFL